MSGNRNKYTSAPLYGAKNIKAIEKQMKEQKADLVTETQPPQQVYAGQAMPGVQQQNPYARQQQAPFLFASNNAAQNMQQPGSPNAGYPPYAQQPAGMQGNALNGPMVYQNGMANGQLPYQGNALNGPQAYQNAQNGQLPYQGNALNGPQAYQNAQNGRQFTQNTQGYRQPNGTQNNAYTPNAPYGFTQPPVQQEPPVRNASAPQSPAPGSADTQDTKKGQTWLIILLLAVLPLLFVASLFFWQPVLKIIFIICALSAVVYVWSANIFTKNAKYTVTAFYAILLAAGILTLYIGLASPENGNKRTTPAGRTNTSVSATVPVALATTSVPDEYQNEPTVAVVSPSQMRLEAFMAYWAENQLDSMVSMCLPSWSDNLENPKQEMFFKIANRTPLSYKIESLSGSDADTSRTISLTVLFSKGASSEPVYHAMQVLMLRLNETWYVDPDSLGSTKLNATPDPNAPNAGTIPFVPTDAPTPTPEPQEITFLYYNPDGGKYYHADQNCSNVDKKYLPLTPFYFTDINVQPYKNLLACPKCNAPARPMVNGN